MSEGIAIALIGLCGSGIGSLVGAVISGKVWQYRIEQLEIRVEKHNNLIERVYRIEEEQTVTGEKLKVLNHRVKDLENEVKTFGLS